jgi:glycosyltransferase involved in cell wall biosynthesis
MSQDLVSIVIPCYNAEAYISDAINSALAQTYPNTEVIVVDDGSTDESLKVIKSYGHRIRWETGENRGACTARNRGVELSRGKFIQFLDSDDRLYSNKLFEQMKVIADHPGKFVFCDCRFSNCDTTLLAHCRKDPIEDPLIFMLRGGLQTSAPIHSKDWITDIGGWDENLPCAQERDLHLRIAATGRPFLRIPKMLYSVRKIEGSVSSNPAKVLDQHKMIALKLVRILEETDALTTERREAIAGFLARDAREYLHHRCFLRSKDYFQLARTIHPSGGINIAYSSKTRWMYHLFGPTFTQVFSNLSRRLMRE